MVVCRCRKATKVYCFVHKAPVCADCICLPEHRICVVKTYSDWVIDGDYDWPPKCSACQAVIQEEDSVTTRLGCLHNVHTSCLESHLESFPPYTAPAGYGCPTCSTAVWPPNKYFKESGSALYSRLKDVISQLSAAKTLLGADAAAQARTTPLAFSTGPLAEIPTLAIGTSEGDLLGTRSGIDADSSTVSNNFENNHVNSGESPLLSGNSILLAQGSSQEFGHNSNAGPLNKTLPGLGGATINIISPESRFSKPATATTLQPGATTRKHAVRVDRSHSGSYVDHDDRNDEDGISRKYSRRGPAYRQLLKHLPFWSSTLPTLPITSSTRKDGQDSVEGEEIVDDRRRRRYRSSTMDVRNLILIFAIMSCLATAMLLYYRLSQSSAPEDNEDQ